MRLFIAAEIPEAWRDAAGRHRAALERVLSSSAAGLEARPALRWVDESALHLTLRFLGEWPEARVPELGAALDALEWPLAPSIALGRPGFFGMPERLTVVWLSIEGERDGLERLVAGIERAVVGAGATAETRPYRPHLTLARVRSSGTRAHRRVIASAVGELRDAEPEAATLVPLEVRRVALIRSQLGSQGPRYEVVSRHSPVA